MTDDSAPVGWADAATDVAAMLVVAHLAVATPFPVWVAVTLIAAVVGVRHELGPNAKPPETGR